MITLMAIAVGSLVVASGVWIYFTVDEHLTRRAALREINLTHMRQMAMMQMRNSEFMLRMGMNPATFPTCSPSRHGVMTSVSPQHEAQRMATVEQLRSTLGLTPYPPPAVVTPEEAREMMAGIPAPALFAQQLEEKND